MLTFTNTSVKNVDIKANGQLPSLITRKSVKADLLSVNILLDGHVLVENIQRYKLYGTSILTSLIVNLLEYILYYLALYYYLILTVIVRLYGTPFSV